MARIIILLISILSSIIFAGQRGIWVVRNSLSTQNDLEILQQITRTLKLTDLYFQVRALGKDVIPQKTNSQTVGLQDILRFCDQNNVRFHAWINTFYVWSLQSDPGDAWHTILQDKQHRLTDAEMKLTTPDDLKKSGIEGYFVDPEATANLNQVKKLIKRLISKFGIHGIHFDYFRLPPPPVHYSVFLRTKFLRNYFLDPAKLQIYRNEFSTFFGVPVYQRMDQRYQKFLQNELTRSLNDLATFVKSLEPDGVVSVAVKPDIHAAKNRYAQDWQRWISDEICDYVVMMNYAPDHNAFKKNLKMAKSIKRDKRIVAGIGAYYLDGLQISERMQEIERMGFNGYCLFSFTTLKDKPYLIRQLSMNSVFRN